MKYDHNLHQKSGFSYILDILRVFFILMQYKVFSRVSNIYKHRKEFNPFGAAVDYSRHSGRPQLATIVDTNATALEIFSTARYVI